MSKDTARKSGVAGGSLVSHTADQLRQSIFNGTYPPGCHLRELRIANELGVSQATVREALQQLESRGLVVRQPNIGTVVARLSPQEVRERVELRAMLEVRAAEEAAGRMGDDEFAELERRLAVLATAIRSDSYYEAARADMEFHQFVWKCSGNETLCRTLDQITLPLLAFVSVLRANGLQHLADVTAAHEPLVAALRSKDKAQIREAFTRGATSSYEDFFDLTSSSRWAHAFGLLDGRREGA